MSISVRPCRLVAHARGCNCVVRCPVCEREVLLDAFVEVHRCGCGAALRVAHREVLFGEERGPAR